MTIRLISRSVVAILALVTSMPFLVQAVEIDVGKTRVILGGYAKLDLIYNDASNGRLTGEESAFGTDFYLPFAVPVEGDGESHQTVYMHAKESRIILGTMTGIQGNKLGTYLEMDFLTANTGANELFSNSFSPRLRQYYFTFNDLLMGQTWSTFQNVDALPETLDFVGPAESTIFVRQPEIRYTIGAWQFAIENPEPELYNNGGPPAIVNGEANVFRLGTRTQDATVPDGVVRYDFKTKFGWFAIAGLGRVLEVDAGNPNFANVEDKSFGYGISFSGVIPASRGDEIQFAVNGGDGIGRYMGFGPADGVINDNGDIETIPQYGGYVGYTHLWNSQWRSNVVASYRHINNPVEFTGTNVEETAYSGHVNLLYSPVAPLMFGIEFLRAQRELESGADGNINRVQFSGKYMF
jgi:hypothetical protein